MHLAKHKTTLLFLSATMALTVAACNSEKESPAAIAQRWCELNGKAHRAEEGSAKEAARKDLKDYEQSIEAKHKDDKSFMAEVEKEVEKCEAASEGRQ